MVVSQIRHALQAYVEKTATQQGPVDVEEGNQGLQAQLTSLQSQFQASLKPDSYVQQLPRYATHAYQHTQSANHAGFQPAEIGQIHIS